MSQVHLRYTSCTYQVYLQYISCTSWVHLRYISDSQIHISKKSGISKAYPRYSLGISQVPGITRIIAVRVVIIVPMNYWQNSTPFWCKASLCTIKFDECRTYYMARAYSTLVVLVFMFHLYALCIKQKIL